MPLVAEATSSSTAPLYPLLFSRFAEIGKYQTGLHKWHTKVVLILF